MSIVDAQIHLWGQGLPSNMAHRQVTSFLAPEAISLMDEANVSGAVIHPPSWDPTSEQLAIQAVADYPGRFAIMASPPLEGPGAVDRVRNLRKTPGMLGIRYTFLAGRERELLSSGDLDPIWEAAEVGQVRVAALCTDSLSAFARIAEKHPDLRITIDHLGGRGGNTTLKDHAAMTHMPELLALARYPNIAVKATGAPGYSGEGYPFPIMLDYVRQVFETFGPERTFWGTDITKMPCSWTECIDMFTAAPWLNGDDQRLVMGDAICDWWGWDRTSA